MNGKVPRWKQKLQGVDKKQVQTIKTSDDSTSDLGWSDSILGMNFNMKNHQVTQIEQKSYNFNIHQKEFSQEEILLSSEVFKDLFSLGDNPESNNQDPSDQEMLLEISFKEEESLQSAKTIIFRVNPVLALRSQRNDISLGKDICSTHGIKDPG